MIYNDGEKKSKVNKNTMGRGHVDSLPDWGGFVASSFVRREKRIKGKYWAEAQEKMKNKKKKKNRLGREVGGGDVRKHFGIDIAKECVYLSLSYWHRYCKKELIIKALA